MANIVIKRKLTLEFLGSEHADDYLTFKSIPVVKYDEIVDKIDNVEDTDNKGATQIMLSILKEYFLDGSFGGDKVLAEDLDELDGTTVMKCFETLTGQVADEEGQLSLNPKSENKSITTSTTEADTPEKS